MSKLQKPAAFPNTKTLRALLKTEPTPFYLYDGRGMYRACRALSNAFSWNEGFRACFPVRMNPNPAVLNIFREAGCGVLCGSEAELLLSQKAGFSGREMLYASLTREDGASLLAAKLHAGLVADDGVFLPEAAPDEVLLTVRPRKPLTVHARTVWNFEKSKLGVREDRLPALFRSFPESETASRGLALFLRDQENSPDAFCAGLERLFEQAAQLYRQERITVGTVFVSGGLGACELESEENELRDVSRRVRESYEKILSPLGLRVRIQIAPGRFLAASHGLLATKVLEVRREDPKPPLVILDVTCGQFLREIAFGAAHRMDAPFVSADKPRRMTCAAGCLPDIRDRFSGEYLLPELKAGDCVVILDTGADGAGFQSGYGGSLRCAEFLVGLDGKLQCIRSRQTAQELLASYNS